MKFLIFNISHIQTDFLFYIFAFFYPKFVGPLNQNEEKYKQNINFE